MPRLTPPTTDPHTSFLDAMAEFHAEGRGTPDDHSAIGHDLRHPTWTTPEGFASYVDDLHAQTDPRTPPPPGRVHCTTWWWTHHHTWLGRIALRHHLTDELRHRGGHIGYDVRPTARRRGHATAMLAAVLPHARALGIRHALLTCDPTNTASRKVIEAHGGVLTDHDEHILRFWVPTDT